MQIVGTIARGTGENAAGSWLLLLSRFQENGHRGKIGRRRGQSTDKLFLTPNRMKVPSEPVSRLDIFWILIQGRWAAD